MNKVFSWLSILIAPILCWPTHAVAGQAQALLYPTRLVLANDEHTATLGIKNTGTATGGYRVELVDMHMQEEGSVVQLKPEETEPFSAKKFIRISPRSISLGAGESQNIRILVRAPDDLEAGEYRTHIKVMLVNDNLDGTGLDTTQEPPKDVRVVVKPRLSLVIPLIIRRGKTSYSTAIESATLRYIPNTTGKKPYIDLLLTRTGNRSSMGNIAIDYTDKNGKTYPLKRLAGLPIYRPTTRRRISLPLDIPPGLTLGKGTLHVTYRAQAAAGGGLLAEGDFPL